MTAPQTRTRTSSWAVASLVLGILGALVFLVAHTGPLALLAVIAGHAGLRDTRTDARTGRGLAVAGLVLGYCTIAVAVAGAIASA